jgi:hypothetical protein
LRHPQARTLEKFSTATFNDHQGNPPLSQNPPFPMAPPRTRKAATTSTASVPPTASGRQHALSSKQQELGSSIFLKSYSIHFNPLSVANAAQKEATTKKKAYTAALRAHQRNKEAMGFVRQPVNVPEIEREYEGAWLVRDKAVA